MYRCTLFALLIGCLCHAYPPYPYEYDDTSTLQLAGGAAIGAAVCFGENAVAHSAQHPFYRFVISAVSSVAVELAKHKYFSTSPRDVQRGFYTLNAILNLALGSYGELNNTASRKWRGCGWAPFIGHLAGAGFTYVNSHISYAEDGTLYETSGYIDDAGEEHSISIQISKKGGRL